MLGLATGPALGLAGGAIVVGAPAVKAFALSSAYQASTASIVASEAITGVPAGVPLLGAGVAIRAAETTAFGAPRLGLEIPQGLGPRTFDVVSGKVRAAVGDLGLGDDIFVMGSRSGGTARAASDFDFGVRVSPDRFDELITQSFGNARRRGQIGGH